jgi:hypothetical protein
MRYAYEDISDDQFECLIVLICQRLLGIAVQGFAKGPDGGKDGRFVGTAKMHPSQANPWRGKTILQAKHTNGLNRSFSETDFFNPPSANTILGQEIPRIRKLKADGHLDHYMLFANRRLTGKAVTDITSHISTECGIPEESIYLCGVEQLELWLRRFDDVVRMANLDPVDSPLIVSPDDLAEVVAAFASHSKDAVSATETPPGERTTYARKNEMNNMTEEYANDVRKRYLKDSHQIAEFLAAPENQELLNLYESATAEFQAKIIAKRKDSQTFDNVMEYLLDLLYARDPILRQRQHKRLTRAMLFHMYWNCDIGRSEDAAA